MAARDKNGRLKKGHKGLKPKGAVSQKTKMWEEMGEFFVTEGAQKYLEYLKDQDPENYMKRFEAMLEYFKPKLARTELTGKDGKDLEVNLIDGYSA